VSAGKTSEGKESDLRALEGSIRRNCVTRKKVRPGKRSFGGIIFRGRKEKTTLSDWPQTRRKKKIRSRASAEEERAPN